MFKKIFFWILMVEILISWPISLIKNPAKFKFETIFYPTTQEESLDFQQKIALDTSQLKRFYYNKTTAIKERYLKNVLVLMDPNNYFFAMHPREDVSGINYRFKYPVWVIIFLIPAIQITVKNKKYFKVWWIFFGEIMALAFLKNTDGFDFILFLPISYLIYVGVKEFNKIKYSWVINLGLIFLMAIEIGRMWL